MGHTAPDTSDNTIIRPRSLAERLNKWKPTPSLWAPNKQAKSPSRHPIWDRG